MKHLLKTALLWLLLNYSGLLYSNMPVANSPALLDQSGRPFDFEHLKGNVVLLFFGYTSCPDVCPMEVSMMAKVLKQFSASQQPVKGVFVSVDSERDTPEVLAQYLKYFYADITGLTGDAQSIDKVIEHFHAHYQIERLDDGSVSVKHSSNLFVLNQQGAVDTMVPFGLGTNHVIEVVERLLENRNYSNEDIK